LAGIIMAMTIIVVNLQSYRQQPYSVWRKSLF
jgi:hypothetical protein